MTGQRRRAEARGPARATAILARVVVLLMLLGTGVAHADDLADARVALDELRYDAALPLLEKAWRHTSRPATERAAICSLAGQAAGAMGDEDAARLWFSRWLAIEPDAKLPAGSSPKLTALLEDARNALPRKQQTVETRPVRRAWYERWSTWSIVAGGATVIGGVSLAVAIKARGDIEDLNDASATHEFSETRPLEKRFDRAQWVSRFAFGGAVIAGGASLVLYMTGRGEQRVVVAPSSDGGSVSWSGRW